MDKEMNSIKEEIIELLKRRQKSSFGDMVKELPYTYEDILNNVMSLKNEGRIKKQKSPPGYYQLD